MAQRVVYFSATVTPSATPASPQTFPMTFNPADVERIDVKIPAGPSGNVGFYIGYGGGQFIPEGTANWIIPDNDYLSFPLVDAPNGGNWSLVGYNLGNYNHTIYVTFLLNNLAAQTIASLSPAIGL